MIFLDLVLYSWIWYYILGFGIPDLVNYCGFGFFLSKSEIQPVTHQRVRKNMACLKNDWYPIDKDNPEIMKEAGLFSIKKKGRQYEAKGDKNDLQEESLDGKPKAVTQIKKKPILKTITYGPKSPNILKNALDKNNNVPDEVRMEVSNTNAAADGSSILLSPGQFTLGNDSYLEGYSHASNYSGTYLKKKLIFVSKN